MTRPAFLCASVLVLVCGTVTVQASPPAAGRTPPASPPATTWVAPEDRNAAIKYLALAMQMPRDLSEKVAAINYEACGITMESLEKEPSAAAALKALESYDVRPWIAASTLRKYDLELAREEGFGLLLPHLGKFREASRVLRFSARVSLAQGKPAEAAERLATIVRMSRHVSQDRILISSLVATAMTALATEEMRTLAAGGLLDDHGRTILLESLEALDPQDPFLLRACIRFEQQLATEGLRAQLKDPNFGRGFVESLLPPGDDLASRMRSKTISEWNGEQFADAIDRMQPAFDAIEQAWDAPDALAAIANVEARAEAGEFGMLAAVILPSFKIVRSAADRARENLESTLAAIRSVTPAERPATPSP